MATKSLTFELFGRDRTASSAISGVGNSAFNAGRAIGQAGKAIAAGLAIGAAAAVAFGKVSVEAFAEAEEAQNRLTFAYAKFPAAADVSIEALREFNSTLALTTKYDDDAIAASQGLLLQFGLTGRQLKALTPLLLDYASAQGKDLTTAAEDFGKALLGQGRALKLIGLEFEDTGTLAGNLEQLMSSLTTQVGGFAETEGKTAAGQVAILKNRFGELQETIGAALYPSLVKLMDFFEKSVMPGLESFANWFSSDGVKSVTEFGNWLIQWKDVILPGVALGFTGITVAAAGLSVALSANPIGAFIAALIAGTAWAVYLGQAIGGALGQALLMVPLWSQLAAAGFTNMINTIIAGINTILGPLNSFLSTLNRLTGFGVAGINVTGLDVYVPSTTPSTPGAGGRTGGRWLGAAGGIASPVAGGIPATIAEAGVHEAVIPLTPQNLAAIGGGGSSIVINVPGGFVGNEDQLAKTVVRAIQNARSRGQISAGALA